MPTLACCVADAPASSLVTGMLTAVPDRGSQLHLARAGRCVLGLAADQRLPGEGSICEDRGWAAVVVGTLDDVRDQNGGALAARVVLATVRVGGPEALNRLRGVFATVVTDGQRVWAARDHVGTETLYYQEVPGGLLLVSEPKQLEAIPGIRLLPDVEVVEAIFYGEDCEPGRSVYRGVVRLGMGSYLEWSETGSRVGRYWRPEALLETARLTPGEIAERFDELMGQAVRRTLRDRTAVLLSGGIDSPAVAAYAGVGRAPGVGAISAVYPQHPTVDERGLIEMLATRYGLELQTFTPGPLKLDRLAEWVRTFDGPWSAWHPGWSEQSYRFAAERGYSVVLTGFFAELLADLTRGLVPHLVATGRVRPALAYLADQRARGGSGAAMLRTLVSTFAPRWATSGFRRRRPAGPIPSWMDAGRLARRDRAQAAAPRARWTRAQLGFLAGPQPSMEAYAKLQARCGVRARHPWSDVDLWEFFLSLPAEAKHPDSRSKALLRNVLRGRLPDAILDRRKMVFNAYITDRIDYASLCRWLVNPPVRLAGIDYEKLAERLAAADLPMSEFMWAKDLATAHAFLAQWCS
jgi:asparagine synthase (glutamine-hydrolysing)